MLTFLEVRPGSTVDYFSAGGYYTELLSRGRPDGKVIAYNNREYLKFSGKPTQRYGNNACRTS